MNGSASAAMSTPERRLEPQPSVPYPATNLCQRCGAKSVLQPLPAAPSAVPKMLPQMSEGPFVFHTCSPARVASGLR